MEGRRPASNARCLGIALTLALVCTVTGCGREPVQQTVRVPDEPVVGYAYTARLVGRHPLWDALQELETAVEDLGDDEWEPVLSPIDRRFEEMAFIESFALADPQPHMARLRRDWRSDYPPLLLQSEGLASDLEARIEWERRQAEQIVARKMAQARSRESRRLARMRAALVEKYQERLTNLSIEATVRQDEAAAAAEEERQRVWETIESQMSEARETGQEELSRLEAELRERVAERVRIARDRASDASSRRLSALRSAGAELHEEMIARIDQPWTTPAAATASANATGEAANDRMQDLEVSREAAELARREKMQQQRERMRAAAERLRSQIKAGTETAAKVVAYRQGIRLQMLPGGQRRGEDVTDLIDEELEKFWTVGGGQGS